MTTSSLVYILKRGLICAMAVSFLYAGPINFKEGSSFALGRYFCENHIAVADFNGDERQDIALALTGRIPLIPLELQSRPNGEILLSAVVDEGLPNVVLQKSLNLRDWISVATNVPNYLIQNRAGEPASFFRLHFALANTSSETMWIGKVLVLTNSGAGLFTEAATIHAENANAYAYYVGAYDFNADGSPDLIYRMSPEIGVALNNNDGSFQQVWSDRSLGDQLDVADMNGDAVLDIASAPGNWFLDFGQIILMLGGRNIKEGFSAGETKGWGGDFETVWSGNYEGSHIRAIDLDGKGISDFVFCESFETTTYLRTFIGETDGQSFSFKPVQQISLGNRSFALATGRIDDDALLDVAVSVRAGTSGNESEHIELFTNNGNGTLTKLWQSPEVGYTWNRLAFADFDRDGKNDLFVGTYDPNVLRVFRNLGAGTFELSWEKQFTGKGGAGAVADLNGDGRPDLIVGEENMLRVLLNNP